MAEFSARRVARRPWLTVLVVAAVGSGLAACGGSGSPQVASLPNSSGNGGSAATSRSTTTTSPKGNPTTLVDEWAGCERGHGDASQPDPIIDAHGVINITIPPPGSGGTLVGDPHDVTGMCSRYLAAAQSALRAADPVQDPLGMTNQSDLLKYVACVRASGVPNYPYPSGPNDSETNFNGTGVDPTSPSVVKVSIRCGSKLHLPLWWSAGWGPPGDVSVSMSIPPGAPTPGPLVPASRAPNGRAPQRPPVSGANPGPPRGG